MDPQRAGEKRKRKDEQVESRDKRNRLGDSRAPRVPQSRYSGYTPLSVLREQLLMQIRDLDLLRKPKEIRTAPNQRDRSKYCRYHKDHGHNTNDCFDLKEEKKQQRERESSYKCELNKIFVFFFLWMQAKCRTMLILYIFLLYRLRVN